MTQLSTGVDLEKFIETADIPTNGGPNQAARVRRVNIDGVLTSNSVIDLAQLDTTGASGGDVIMFDVGVADWMPLPSNNVIQTIPAGGAAQTLDPNVYAAFLLTLTAAITLTITAPTAPGQHTITVYTIQDITGTWVVTWPASVDWNNNTPPVPTLTAGTRSLYILTTLDGGVHWTGSMVGTALA